MKYFSYDPNYDGFDFHKTAEDARNQAQERIQSYLDDGWDDMVEQVCWGEIREMATKTNVLPDDSGEYDYSCSYELEKVK